MPSNNRFILLTCLFCWLISVSVPGYTGSGKHASSNHYSSNGYSRHHFGKHYNRGYSHGSNFGYNYGSNYGYKRHHDHSKYLLGGLLVGALIHHSFYRPHYPYKHHSKTIVHRTVYHSPPQVIHHYPSTVITRTEPTQITRRLLRDLEGRCFEIARRDDGTELLIEIERDACRGQ